MLPAETVIAAAVGILRTALRDERHYQEISKMHAPFGLLCIYYIGGKRDCVLKKGRIMQWFTVNVKTHNHHPVPHITSVNDDY
jgi:hypothetical protein